MVIRSFLHIALACMMIFITKKSSLIARDLNKIGLIEPALSYENNGIAQKNKKLENLVSGFMGKTEVAITNYHLHQISFPICKIF